MSKEYMDTIGNYHVTNVIGHGRFGAVFKATTPDWINIVAIKKIAIADIFEDDLVNDMKKVIVNMQTLHHQNIIGAHEVIKSDKHICMVMSYITGLNPWSKLKFTQILLSKSTKKI